MRRTLIWLLALALLLGAGAAAASRKSKPASRKTAAPRSTASKAKARNFSSRTARKPPAVRAPAPDPTAGDTIDGDDLAVRRAAVEALGPYYGSVVVVDPDTGRILTIVNQKLALQSGFVPCSTIKIVTALAALSEGVVARMTPLPITRRTSMNMTTALALSNNQYFSALGRRLGFETVCRYARMFGLGEQAGLGIEGEQPGELPDVPPPGGVGMMTSFGTGISQTPLELASMLAAISNGGTLYYLQYPRSQQEVDDFVPRIKRRLEIDPWLPDVKVGMRAAVEFGTARRAAYDESEPVLGKTGTCTDSRSSRHLGWFGSFNDVDRNRLVTVVLLTGGSSVNGPVAAGVAGSVYRQLSEQRYFASASPERQGVSLGACCAP